MASELDDALMTPRRPGAPGASEPPMTRSQASRTIANQIEDTSKHLQLVGDVGEKLMATKQRLMDRLKEVENHKGDELSPDLRQQLEDLQKEYDDVGRENARAFSASASKSAYLSSAYDTPSKDTLGIPDSPSNLSSTTPTNKTPSSRKQRNQPNRLQDIQFATDIGHNLIVTVRQLQNLLNERDEKIKLIEMEKSKLEYETEQQQSKLQKLDDSEQRYREENWNLELSLQDLRAAATASKDAETKLNSQINSITAEKNLLAKEMYEVKQNHAKELDASKTSHKATEMELASMKRNATINDTERAALKRKIDELSSELEESQKDRARLRHEEYQGENASELGPEDVREDDQTPDNSPPPSPSKATPRHNMLEAETLKSSLHHAHRMITNLKSTIHREKTEKAELRRMLQDARDDLEQSRTMGSQTSSSAKRKKADDGKFKKPLRPPIRMGDNRKAHTDITMVDQDWEDHEEEERKALTEDSDRFDTAAESAFETANEAETTDAYRTGVESMNESTGDDTETDTPFVTPGVNGDIDDPFLKPIPKPDFAGNGSIRSSKRGSVRDRFPVTNESDASDDDGAFGTIRGVTQPPSQRLKLKVNRGQRRGVSDGAVFMNRGMDSVESTPPSAVHGNKSLFAELGGTSSVENTPPPAVQQASRSLFAELGDLSPGNSDDELVEPQSATLEPTKRDPVSYREFGTATSPVQERVKEVEKIVTVYVDKPVEVIKEVPVDKIVEVIKEVPVEVIKEVPVEKIVEVTKEVPVEVIKEVPVEKIVEVTKEVPVEVIVEKVVEKEVIVEKIVEKEVPVDREVEKEVVKEVPVDRIVEVPVEKIVEVTKEVPVEVIVEKIIEKEVPVEKIVEVTKEVPVEVPVERIVEKEVIKEVPVEVIREVPVEKIVEITKEVPVEVIVEKIVEKEIPIDRIVDREVPVEKIVEITKEVPVEVIVEKIVEKEVPVEKIVEKIVEKEIEVERIVEKPVDRIVEVPVEKVVERIVEVPRDVIVEKIVEVPREVVVEKIVERVVEVPVERIVERIVEVERPAEKEKENAGGLAATALAGLGLGAVASAARNKEPHIASDETATYGPAPAQVNGKAPLREISNNQGTYTSFDESKGKRAVLSPETFRPQSSESSEGRRSRGVSIDGGMLGPNDAGKGIRRPGSSTSMRNLQNAPPLPVNADEKIAAARSSTPGLMGPPLVPASAMRNSSYKQATTPTLSPVSTRTNDVTPKPRNFSGRDRSNVSSPIPTRRSSVSSFASDLDERFQPGRNPLPGLGRGGETNDPRLIQAITQTMIGEYMWKYTRNVGRSSLSANRHRRFFWIHPYTKTLYWSDHDPSTSNAQANAKSVSIEGLKVVTDDNPLPPGLHRKSLLIFAPSGKIVKFTAPTGQRHETWLNALSFLMEKSLQSFDNEEQDEVSTTMTNDDAREFDPMYSTAAVRNAPSLSSYNSRTTHASATPTPTRPLVQKTRGAERPQIQPQGSISRLSSYFRSGAPFGSLRGSRSASRATIHSIYDASEVNDSAEDLRHEYERQDRERDRLENVRACCDGAHDVGSLPRRNQGRRSSQSQRGSHQHHHHHHHNTTQPSSPEMPRTSVTS